MKKLNLSHRTFRYQFAMQTIFLIFLFVNNIFPQVEIKERIEINPDGQTNTGMQSNCIWVIEGCTYEDCDSTEGNLVFTPESIGPGETVLIEAGPFYYEGLLGETLNMEPNCGVLNQTGVGTYLFTAPDTLTVDSLVITLNYDIYYWVCWNLNDEIDSTKQLDNRVDCPCFPNGVDVIHNYADEQLIIKWDSLYVEADPSELFPGDTANIIIKKRLPDGTLTDFDTTQTYEAAMLEGCTLGNILVDDSLDAYFYDVNQPIKFVADTTADSTGLVLLRIGLVEETLLSKINNNNEVDMFECLPGPPQTTNGMNIVIEKKAEPTILLGETKYYQAKYKTVDELIIEEAPVGANGIPYLDGGLTEDVWGDNPVSVIDTCTNCGKKMGVYWEKKYPVKNQWVDYTVISGNDTAIYKIVKMDTLQTGLIRLIGRYWTQDSTYLVKLKAKRNNGDSTEIHIKLEKPSQLKSSGQTTSYSYAKDVFDNPVNIDFLCISLGGKYGILPQFIKGQMFKEAAKKNFGDTVGVGFAPSYRYEPYTVQFWSGIKNNRKYNKFYIEDSSYSFSNVPNHNHVLNHDYFRNIKTVWDIIRDYSRLVDGSNSDSTYGNRLSNNFMSFSPYKKESIGIQQTYDDFKGYYIRKYQSQLTMTEIADSTNERMIKYFKKEWKNNGAENIIAQTRAASSYGLLQLLYTTARDREYPNDTIPENINLLNYLDLFLITQKTYLQEGLSINVESGNNWTDGFEYSLSTKIYVPKWNTISTYAQGVYTYSQMFLPKR